MSGCRPVGALKAGFGAVQSAADETRINQNDRTGKRQGAKGRWRVGMSLLVAIEGRWPAQEMGAATKYGSDTWNAGGGRLELEMALDEFAEFFAVFVAHVHEFDAATVRPDVADDGGEIDLAETGADLQLDGVANT